ncbi:MAG: hypothetical protein OES32_14530 [Acidobacteriota bacterium]|nr:hypothetical protein [Acidobacteriota bacterium]MDH3524797.1 hypothetical protein [Acidobacteriota bacterium]
MASGNSERDTQIAKRRLRAAREREPAAARLAGLPVLDSTGL